MKKLIILASLALLAAACSVKGNGEHFYAEQPSSENGYNMIVHSNMNCPCIKEGTSEHFYSPVLNIDVYCPKCMDEALVEKYKNKSK